MLELLLPALLPAAVEGVKNLIGKFTGGFVPANIDEQIKLDNANVEKLKALAALDTPVGAPSQWVVDLRASFRYIAAGALIVAAVATTVIPALLPMQATAYSAASAAFGFIFGERLVMNLKQAGKS